MSFSFVFRLLRAKKNKTKTKNKTVYRRTCFFLLRKVWKKMSITDEVVDRKTQAAGRERTKTLWQPAWKHLCGSSTSGGGLTIPRRRRERVHSRGWGRDKAQQAMIQEVHPQPCSQWACWQREMFTPCSATRHLGPEQAHFLQHSRTRFQPWMATPSALPPPTVGKASWLSIDALNSLLLGSPL